jgi:hypothetical protein
VEKGTCRQRWRIDRNALMSFVEFYFDLRAAPRSVRAEASRLDFVAAL